MFVKKVNKLNKLTFIYKEEKGELLWKIERYWIAHCEMVDI